MGEHEEYVSNMIEFRKWLFEQKDVSEELKSEFDLLLCHIPFPKWFADKFQPYIDRYNKEQKEGE